MTRHLQTKEFPVYPVETPYGALRIKPLSASEIFCQTPPDAETAPMRVNTLDLCVIAAHLFPMSGGTWGYQQPGADYEMPWRLVSVWRFIPGGGYGGDATDNAAKKIAQAIKDAVNQFVTAQPDALPVAQAIHLHNAIVGKQEEIQKAQDTLDQLREQEAALWRELAALPEVIHRQAGLAAAPAPASETPA